MVDRMDSFRKEKSTLLKEEYTYVDEPVGHWQKRVDHVKVILPQSLKVQEMKRSLLNSLVGITLFIMACILFLGLVNLLNSSQSKPSYVTYKGSFKCDNKVYGIIQQMLGFESKENDSSSLPEENDLSASPTCSNIPDLQKFDCYPEPNSNEAGCLKRGCCWKKMKSNQTIHNGEVPLGVPYCFYPSDYQGYIFQSTKLFPTGLTLYLRRYSTSGFPNDVMDITVNCTFWNNNQLQIQIYDSNQRRYEVPLININKFKSTNTKSFLKNRQYIVDYDQSTIWVKRVATGKIIFSMKLNQLVFADQMIQASIRLPSHNVYGLGESKAPFLKNVNWTRYVLFAKDRQPVENFNLYGSHPFYLVMEDDESEHTGNSHGVVLLNSNAMEIVLQPTPAITFRPIGGIIDFLLNFGPSPKEVIQQYTKAIGYPFMPPYWSLGFHLCRFGYTSTYNTREIWDRNRKAGIPIEVQWNDIDYMNNRNDFTLDPQSFSDLPSFVNELHAGGMRYVMIIDPAISNSEPEGSYPPYDDGVQMDIFVKNTTDQILVGKVWNKATSVFPDFTNPKTLKYWYKQLKTFHGIVPFDGAWIDMNEPSNFVDGSVDGCPKDSSLENPPYIPGNIEPLRSKTLCMSAKQNFSTHYNVHNVYGLMETIATNIALSQIRGKRPFIISRSTFPSQGHFGGHWDGDISSTWDNMKWTIPSILNMNMFGISMVGGDICGFNGNTTVELCARWSSLGAFYPFSRNHNSDDTIPQDPVSLGSDVVLSARKALEQRYFLLPYLYTLFFKSHTAGETVARSLMFEFPYDKNTYNIDTQFLWGSGLMIIPVLEPNTTKVEGYLPGGKWYDLKNGTSYSSEKGTRVTFEVAIDEITLLIRGGAILPGQKHEMTTTAARKNDFTLLVALGVYNEANGSLYIDDGDTLETFSSGSYNLINFQANGINNTLISTLTHYYYFTPNMILGTVVIYGVNVAPTKVTLNGYKVEFFYNDAVNVLHCVKLGADLKITNELIWL